MAAFLLLARIGPTLKLRTGSSPTQGGRKAISSMVTLRRHEAVAMRAMDRSYFCRTTRSSPTSVATRIRLCSSCTATTIRSRRSPIPQRVGRALEAPRPQGLKRPSARHVHHPPRSHQRGSSRVHSQSTRQRASTRALSQGGLRVVERLGSQPAMRRLRRSAPRSAPWRPSGLWCRIPQ